MSTLLAGIPDMLVRTSLTLALAAIVVRLFLLAMRPKSPVAHRFAWGCVLVQGVFVAQWPIEVPWYDPRPAAARSAEFDTTAELPDPSIAAVIQVGAGEPSSAPPAVEPADRRRASPLMAIWLGGMALILCVTAGSYSLLLLSMRRSVPARQAWQQEWQQLLGEQRIGPAIPLLVHPTLGPMLCWLPRGYCVVVPGGLWKTFTREQRLAILRHELAHYQRGDVWKSLVARLLILPHWFNPLAWWSVRKFDEGGEWACDQQLADSDPRQVPAFARALLAIVEPDSGRAFASAARGASVSVRLRRLLTLPNTGDSLMKRCLVFFALSVLLTAGLFRLQLVDRAVAQDEEQQERAVSAAFDRGATQLAERLDTDSELMREFQTSLSTPAGKIVLQDRASYFADRLREEAQTNALPGYLDKNFDKQLSDDGSYQYVLQDGRETYKTHFLATAAGFNEDVDKIGAALNRLAERVTGDAEVDRLLARFMKSEAAAVTLYVNELRERLRPDATVIERRLGEIFVANEQGKFIVRPGRREEARKLALRAQQILRILGDIHEELKAMSEEFAEPDEFNKRVKKHLASPLFAAYIAAAHMEGDDESVARRVEHFFNELNHLAVDTADGLAIIEEEPREEVGQAIKDFERKAAVAPKLAGPLKAFAAKIDTADELEQTWQKLLTTPVAALKFAEEFEASDGDPAEIIRDLMGEVLEEGDNGELSVRADNQEEITEFVREQFRRYREVRRHGRTIERAAALIADSELSDAFSTIGGKYLVIYTVRHEFANRDYNGLSMWIEEVFELTDQGLTLRDNTADEIEGFLADVRDVRAELKKDDF